MRELRFAGAWQAAGFAILALALVSLLSPGAARSLPPGNFDKYAHVVGFFLMTAWFTGVYRRGRFGWLALGMLAFGALTEVLQGLLTRSRSADLVDFAADALGIALALAAAMVGLDGWTRRVERVLVRV